jgi:hypothetical protein
MVVLFRLLLAGVFLALMCGWSLAQPTCQVKQDKSADKVKITMVVILASEEGNFVDKRLKAIAEEIQKLNPQLKSFHLKSMTTKSLAPEEKASFPLVDDRSALLVVKHGADKENRVGVAVTAPNQGEIEYRTVCGKFLPIVTRYQTKARERLILAIRVQPCQGD